MIRLLSPSTRRSPSLSSFDHRSGRAYVGPHARPRGPVMSDVVIEMAEDLPPGHPVTKKRKKRALHVAQILLAIAVVVLCFVYAIPKFASYSEVWSEVRAMPLVAVLLVLLASALDLWTYWWQTRV